MEKYGMNRISHPPHRMSENKKIRPGEGRIRAYCKSCLSAAVKSFSTLSLARSVSIAG